MSNNKKTPPLPLAVKREALPLRIGTSRIRPAAGVAHVSLNYIKANSIF
jgi:hypothetical protein